MGFCNGLADEDFKREVLGTTNINTMSLPDTVQLIDSKETDAWAMR